MTFAHKNAEIDQIAWLLTFISLTMIVSFSSMMGTSEMETRIKIATSKKTPEVKDGTSMEQRA